MTNRSRPLAFWLLIIFFTISIFMMLVGQSMSIFNYDLTVQLGLQESRDQVSEFGVQVNRAFGVGDTVIFVPLLIASVFGLWFRKRWSLITTSATLGVSAYWSITIFFMFLFLPNTPGYAYVPGPEIWSFVGFYIVAGIWGLIYMMIRGDTLLQ